MKRSRLMMVLAAAVALPLVGVSAWAQSDRGDRHRYDDFARDMRELVESYGFGSDDRGYRRDRDWDNRGFDRRDREWMDEMRGYRHGRHERRHRDGRGHGWDRDAGPDRMERHGRGMGHGKHGGHRKMRRAQRMIETYDTDGDGSITQAEVDTFRADRLKEFDGDSDGALTLEEYQALWLDAMREKMVDRFQHHDDDGDGKITVEEFSSRTKDMVRMRDRNGDGAFSFDDLGPRMSMGSGG